LRGPEVAYAKPESTYRVLVLGDSFTFGLQVPEEETFVARLGERLNASASDVRFETLNGGSDGWSTIDEYNWLTTEGYRYAPDLVVLMFFTGNDPGDNANPEKAQQRYTRRLGMADDWDSPADRLRSFLRANSAAYNVFEHGVLVKIKSDADTSDQSNADGAVGEQPAARKSDGWKVSETWLGRLRDYCQAQDLQLVVVGIPTDYQVANLQQTSLPLAEISERLGVSYVELLPEFQALPSRQRKQLYLEENKHWTAAAHSLAAEVVASDLVNHQTAPAR
jgi:hypothetical protein